MEGDGSDDDDSRARAGGDSQAPTALADQAELEGSNGSGGEGGGGAEDAIPSFVPCKSCAEGTWQPVLGLVQMRKLKGKFWKKCGFTVNGVNFLYPEEALCLYERKLVAVYFQDGRLMNKREFFEACLSVIPISCYLVYAKLKAMEYIVGRHHKSIRVLSGDAELRDYLAAHPTHSLLDAMVSYDLFIDAQNFSKTAAKSLDPVGYVVLTDGAVTFSPGVILTLLKEAAGVPILFAIVSSAGYVMLQELTDAERSLQPAQFSARS